MSHEPQIRLLKEVEHQLGVEGGGYLEEISRYEGYIMDARTKNARVTERAQAVRESIAALEALDRANISFMPTRASNG